MAARKRTAANTSDAATSAADQKNPYAGENPHPEGSWAWHSWNYLKSTTTGKPMKSITEK